MGTTLENGIYLPDEGERNCYDGLAGNWVALDNHLGSTDIHVTINDKQAWNGHVADTTIHVTSADKQAWNGKADASALTAHTGDTTIHVTAEDKQAWNGKADASALTAHTGDTTIHVTAEDKQAWNGKADASALTAHTGDTTIHVTAEDKQAWNGKADASALNAHTGDTTIHVTAEDKAKWDAVTSKADDSDVVHKSGNETVSGQKLFDDINVISSSSEIGVSGGNNSFTVLDKNNKILARLQGGTFSTGMAYSYWLVNNGTDAFNGIFLYQASANLVQLRPYDSTLSAQLGASNRYFTNCYTSKVNGLNPSSLSLPGYSSSKIDISSYITDLTGGSNNYTAPSNGYIFVRTNNGTYLKLTEYPSEVISSVCSQTVDDIGTFIPVLAGRICIIQIKCSSIDRAYFIPCLGNV